MATKACPFCAEDIQEAAVFCRHCHHDLRTGAHASAAQARRWSPGVAGLLSFLIPGAGSIYKGQIGLGVLWFILTAIGYWLFVLPGVLLHLVGIAMAAGGDPNADPTAAVSGVESAPPLTPEERAAQRRRARKVFAWVGGVVLASAAGITWLSIQAAERQGAVDRARRAVEATRAADAARRRADAEEIDRGLREKKRMEAAIRAAGFPCLWVETISPTEAGLAVVACEDPTKPFRVEMVGGWPVTITRLRRQAQQK